MKKTVIILTLFCAAALRAGTVMHPPVELVDESGRSVLESGGPVSAMTTCGACHDTHYIESHSYHADLGLNETTAAGKVPGGRAWDSGTGPFGRWDPLTYRVLDTPDSPTRDLGTPDWVRLNGARLVGGGPARYARDGARLEQKPPSADDPETSDVDNRSGATRAWDWRQSGTLEMDCFLCHTPKPSYGERTGEIGAGRFGWASTATLSGSGLVSRTSQGWRWERTEFDLDGTVSAARLGLGDPTSENCAPCHARAHYGESPLTLEHNPTERSSETAGQLWSPKRISDSQVNVAGRDSLDRPWDVHAERLLECSSCHYSIGNPAYYREPEGKRPSHLAFDARKQDIGDYLRRPSHEFAKGESAVNGFDNELDGSMRRCEDCHNREAGQSWHPFSPRHLRALSCEACHIPSVHAPALAVEDWTLLTPRHEPRREYRGIDGDPGDPTAFVNGFEPVLLPRREADGGHRLFPYNLVSSWYWVSGDPARPVPQAKLEQAFFEDGAFDSSIMDALDGNRDGVLEDSELRLDTPERTEAVRARLEAVGVDDPRIAGEVQPVGIHHNIAPGGWATRSCTSCHAADSRLTRRFRLASFTPGGVAPQIVGRTNVDVTGEFMHASPEFDFVPSTIAARVYVPGHDRTGWIDLAGLFSVLAVLAGVLVHGTIRVVGKYRKRGN